MLPEPSFTTNVLLVKVEAVMASEKVAVIEVFIGTSMSLSAGLVEMTVGGVVSGSTPVVK